MPSLDMSWLNVPSAVGTFGVLMILSAYWMLQTQRIDRESPRYSALNATGAALVLYSLYFDFNFPSAMIESAWLVISLYGLWQSLRGRASSGPEASDD